MFLKETRMSILQHCVYILFSLKDKKLYIGYTTNLKKRLTDHFHGRSKATAPRRPFKLIYCEYFFSKHDAYRREKYLKTSAGKKMLRLMLRQTMNFLKNNSLKRLEEELVNRLCYKLNCIFVCFMLI